MRVRVPRPGTMVILCACLAGVAAAAHHDSSFSLVQLLCYGAGLVLLPLGVRGQVGTRELPTLAPWQRLDTLLLVLILVPAIGLRVYHLGTVPLVIFSDEISYSRLAVDLLRGNLVSPFASGSWDSLYLHIYAIAGAYFITPSMTIAARLVGVVPGLLAIWLEYVVLRRLFGRPLAFIASLLMCLCAWNILIDRYSYQWAINQFTELAAIYWFIVALRSERPLHFVFAGYGLGVGVLYTYDAAFLPFALVAFLGYLYLAHRPSVSRRLLLGYAWMVLAAFLVAAPRLTIAATDPATLSYHRSVSVTNLPPTQIPQVVGRQYGEILTAFNWESDTDPRAHPRGTGPLLDPIMAAALALGALYAARKLRQLNWGLLVCSTLALLLPAALSYGQTAVATSWRACGVVPFLCAFAAVPFALMWNAARGNPWRRQWLITGFAFLAVLLGVINCQYYFVDFAGRASWQTDDMLTETYAADRALDAPASSNLQVNADLLGNVYVETLTYGRRVFQPINWPDIAPIPVLFTTPLREATVLADGQLDYAAQTGGRILMDELSYYYPCGSVDRRTNALGESLVLAFTAQPSCIRTAQGLIERVGAGASRILSAPFDWRQSPTGHFPFQVTLSGTLVVPVEGAYTMSLAGVPSARLTLDGQLVAHRWLLPGLYTLRVSATVNAPVLATLGWNNGGGGPVAVPEADLLARNLPSWGLRASYTFADGSTTEQWVPGLLMTQTGVPFSQRPIRSIVYRGAILLGKSGVDQFSLQSASFATLAIRGARMAPPNRSLPWLSWWQLTAAAGWHPMTITVDQPKTQDLRYFWLGPDNQYHALGGAGTRW